VSRSSGHAVSRASWLISVPSVVRVSSRSAGQRVGQREDAGAGARRAAGARCDGGGLAGVDLAQQAAGQLLFDVRSCLPGGLGDGELQGALGHRRQEEPVLDGSGEFRVLIGTTGLEVGPGSCSSNAFRPRYGQPGTGRCATRDAHVPSLEE
jgi:hypothetical protein